MKELCQVQAHIRTVVKGHLLLKILTIWRSDLHMLSHTYPLYFNQFFDVSVKTRLSWIRRSFATKWWYFRRHIRQVIWVQLIATHKFQNFPMQWPKIRISFFKNNALLSSCSRNFPLYWKKILSKNSTLFIEIFFIPYHLQIDIPKTKSPYVKIGSYFVLNLGAKSHPGSKGSPKLFSIGDNLKEMNDLLCLAILA